VPCGIGATASEESAFSSRPRRRRRRRNNGETEQGMKQINMTICTGFDRCALAMFKSNFHPAAVQNKGEIRPSSQSSV